MADEMTPVTITCPNCGTVSSAGQKFCGNCGAKLEQPEDTSKTEELGTAKTETMAAVPSPDVPAISTPAPAAVVADPATVAALASAVLPDGTRERERDRLLTLANVQRMRGQLSESRKSLETVLALSEGRSPREMSPVHEMLGDLLANEGKWEEAQAVYETAHNLDTERVAAEKKFAEAALRVAEAKAIANGSTLGLVNDNFGEGSFGGGIRGKRNPGLAMLASLFVPGFGQFFNGELLKGGICLSVFLLTLLAVRLSRDSEVLFAKMTTFLSPNNPAAAKAGLPLSPLLVTLLIVAGIVWLYSLIDAAAAASRTSDNSKDVLPPAGDRAGWEP